MARLQNQNYKLVLRIVLLNQVMSSVGAPLKLWGPLAVNPGLWGQVALQTSENTEYHCTALLNGQIRSN